MQITGYKNADVTAPRKYFRGAVCINRPGEGGHTQLQSTQRKGGGTLLFSDKFKKDTEYQEVVNEPRTVFFRSFAPLSTVRDSLRSRNRMNCFLWSGMVSPLPNHRGRRRSLLHAGYTTVPAGTADDDPALFQAQGTWPILSQFPIRQR